MRRKILLPILSLIFALCSLLFVGAACSINEGNSDKPNDEIYSIYTTYVAYAEENGQAPLSYEDWLASIKGEKGETGKGITSISLVKSIDNIDYYEILFSDGTKFEFTIRNAKQLFFTVTWKDEDGSILRIDENVFYGSYLHYGGDTPTKKSDDERFSYSFAGWEYDESFLGYVTQDLVFTAKYEKINNYETILVYNQYNQLIDSIEIKKGTIPEFELEPISNYIDNDVYYQFNQWYYDSYSKTLRPLFYSYDLQDSLYVYNGIIYKIETINGEIISTQITDNSQITIYDYYMDKYDNIYVRNNTLDYVDSKSNVIYYVGDKYFKSIDGLVVHIDFVGKSIGYLSEWKENLKSIKKVTKNCIEENISTNETIVFNTYSGGDAYIGSIKNGQLYISYFVGWAYSHFTKLDVYTLKYTVLYFGSCVDIWGPMSIYTTNYSAVGMILCVQDENDVGKLYYIDNVWKYDGNTAFYGGIRNDDSLVSLLDENIVVTDWDEGHVEYRKTNGTEVSYYYIEFENNGIPNVVKK